jgi:hypothetical protein
MGGLHFGSHSDSNTGLQFPLRVADLSVRRVGRLFLRIAEQRNPMNRAISVRMIIIGLFYLLYQAGLAQVESPPHHQHCNRFDGACARRNTRNRDRRRTNPQVSEDFQPR